MGPAGIVLAGGRARRMGGRDKTLLPLGGRPLLAHVLERVRPQLGPIAISANGDPARFAAFALPVLPDPIDDNAGPLAGILAGLKWAAASPGVDYLVSVPGDTPFLPFDLVAKLVAARNEKGTELALAASVGRLHPVVGLWPVALAIDLRQALEEGVRKVEIFVRARTFAVAEFGVSGIDPFFNVNRQEDLAEAERQVGHL